MPEADRVSAEVTPMNGVMVSLVPGEGGVFEVRKNSKIIWRKEKDGSFPQQGEILALLKI